MKRLVRRPAAMMATIAIAGGGTAWLGCGSNDVNNAVDKAQERGQKAIDRAQKKADQAQKNLPDDAQKQIDKAQKQIDKAVEKAKKQAQDNGY